MRRSREQLEMEIDKFTIIERDGHCIGCRALLLHGRSHGRGVHVAIHPEYPQLQPGDTLIAKVAERAKRSASVACSCSPPAPSTGSGAGLRTPGSRRSAGGAPALLQLAASLQVLSKTIS